MARRWPASQAGPVPKVLDLGPFEPAEGALRQLTEAERPDTGAAEIDDRVAEGPQRAPQLSLPPLPQDNPEASGVGAWTRPQDAHVRRRGPPLLQDHVPAQLFQDLRAGPATNHDAILLGDVM